MYNFDVEDQAKKVVEWTKNWLKGRDAIVGISGGIDSTLTATICKAAGSKVIGVMMPCGEQKDIEDAKSVCKFLKINPMVINIGSTMKTLTNEIIAGAAEVSYPMINSITDQYSTNTPARIRMTTLYGISALTGGFVAGTGNLTEDAVGYATLFGDSAASFAPILKFTKDEVRALAKYFGVPKHLYEKVSIDGMSLNTDGTYKADEDKLGFSYTEIGDLIRTGKKGSNCDKIIDMYKRNKFKTEIIQPPCYEPDLPNFLESL